jgi:hypothetical protein
MKVRSFAALVVAGLVTVSTGAFASGYGPAPFYRATVGASASQRGQSVQTVAAEKEAVSGTSTFYASPDGSTSEWGSRVNTSVRTDSTTDE